MKFIKDKFSSTIGDQNLSDRLMLKIEHEIVSNISDDSIFVELVCKFPNMKVKLLK